LKDIWAGLVLKDALAAIALEATLDHADEAVCEAIIAHTNTNIPE
jgi:hypothetical protein